MKDETIKKIIDIAIKYNIGKLSCGSAMFQIYQILSADKDKELGREWNKQMNKKEV